MAKLPPKKASKAGPRPMGPKLPPVPSSPVNQPPVKMPKPKKGPLPSSGMPAPMGGGLVG